MKKKHLVIIAVILLCIVAAAIFMNRSAPQAAEPKSMTVEVVHGDGSTAEFTYQTEQTSLGEFLAEEGLIAGEEGPYGLFVQTVDGETVDYDANGSWWMLACNGEEVLTGADAVEIEDGAVYTWTYMLT